MAYASPSDVSILTRSLTSNSAFTGDTNPASADVATWLSSGCAIIESRIGSRGYGAIPITSPAYDFARQANAFYAAWLAELSIISARVSRDENTRDDRFKRAFETQMQMLDRLDLSRLGVTRSRHSPFPYAGGILQSNKDENEADTDIVQSRFKKGQFRNPEAGEPLGTSSS